MEPRFQCKQAYKAAGFVSNRKQEQAVASAVIAAQRIEDSQVQLLDSTGHAAYVTSMQDSSVKYEVQGAGSAAYSCTCPQGQLHYMCKHVVKVVSMSTGYSGAQIIQALGTRAGSSLQGLDKLHNSWHTDTAVDGMTQLQERYALVSSDTAAKQTDQSRRATQQPHDSVSCQQQIDTAFKELSDEVAGNAQLQQHLLSQLRQVQGSIVTIKAKHATGTAHPSAVLDRVQDDWGNSLVRKKAVLDGFPKQRKRQKQAGSSDTAAEQVAEPFNKPTAARKKQGPRHQAKLASSGKENSSAAANAVTDAHPSVAGAQTSKAKPPRTGQMRRCGECASCLNPTGKKGCLRNRALRDQVAASELTT